IKLSEAPHLGACSSRDLAPGRYQGETDAAETVDPVEEVAFRLRAGESGGQVVLCRRDGSESGSCRRYQSAQGGLFDPTGGSGRRGHHLADRLLLTALLQSRRYAAPLRVLEVEDGGRRWFEQGVAVRARQGESR